MKKEQNLDNSNDTQMGYDTLLGVVDWLKTEQGYKEYKETFKHPYKYKTLLQKRVDSECVCECNDKLSININVAEFDLGHTNHESYEIEIVAEKRAKWWKLSCYSMTRAEITSGLKDVEDTLIRLFNYA
jgi:hypothetical protein